MRDLSLADLDDDHDHPILRDFVDDAMLPHTNAIQVVVALELSGALGSRSISEARQEFADALRYYRRQAPAFAEALALEYRQIVPYAQEFPNAAARVLAFLAQGVEVTW